MSQIRQQKQVFAQKQVELLNEFQYTIIQDMENVLGIAMEFLAVEKNQHSLDPELVKVQKNRLILQYNLSNTIHVDQQQTAESKHVEHELSKQKHSASEMFAKIKADLLQVLPNLKQSQALEILEDYQAHNLSLDCKITQKPMEKTNVKANFNQDVVGKVLGAMQKNDQIYEDVRNAKQLIKFDDAEKIKENALRRLVNAQVKLQEALQNEFPEIEVHQDQQKKQTVAEKQSVPGFVSLLLSGLANCFTEQIYQNQIMLFCVIQIAYERKIDLQKLNNELTQLKGNLTSFKSMFQLLEIYLKTGDRQQNPCTVLRSIRITEKELNFLKQYQSDKACQEFWMIKQKQFTHINFILLHSLYEILSRQKTKRIDFPVSDDYDAFLKKQIIELHLQQVKSGQTTTFLQQLRDDEQYQETHFSMSPNLQSDINYIVSYLEYLKK